MAAPMPLDDRQPAPAEGGLSQAPDGSLRLTSLDALRGFDMFWIAGGSYIVGALNKLSDNPVFAFLKSQLSHVDWDGFRFYDLIFPLFVFMTGVSLTFSLTKSIARDGKAAALRRIYQRGILLFLLGIFYSGGFTNEWPGIRVLGVLQRIALAYMGAGTLFVFIKPRWHLGLFLSVLIGYWGILEFVPIRNIRLEPTAIAALQQSTGKSDARQLFEATTETTRGHYEKGFNVSNHFDYQYLPGRLYDTYWDPEGMLSTLPAIGTCLLGVLAGSLLMRPDRSPGSKTAMLLIWGLVSVVVGFAASLHMPVIKKIWTSTFVLVAGGYSLMLLGTFYHVVDVLKWRNWCQPFIWIGTNSITIYFAAQLVRFPRVAERLVGGTIKSHLGAMGEVLVGVTTITLLFLFARALYRRKLFLRL